ncbi:MAG: DUF465 domain-containing protein [Bryobacteraceae bacterium]|jgi:uncharacterized protein YdcH (DUF465 family)|nr:DUF465 domain-containing protein [Bryobacteraceae bacterium]
MENKALEEAKAHLMQSSEEYRTMAGKHAEYSALLNAIEAKPRPTEQDEVEEHRLKKLKLRLKDEMQEMVKRHLAQSEVA